MPPPGQINAECFIRNVIDTRCLVCGTVAQCLLKFKQSERLVLGTPLGTDEYVRGVLATKRTEHDRLLTRIPEVPDLQAAWLLLHYCAAPRANYLLRNVPPALTAHFAADCDAAILAQAVLAQASA